MILIGKHDLFPSVAFMHSQSSAGVWSTFKLPWLQLLQNANSVPVQPVKKGRLEEADLILESNRLIQLNMLVKKKPILLLCGWSLHFQL